MHVKNPEIMISNCVHMLQNADNRNISIQIGSASLQPFTEDEWRSNQETKINEVILFMKMPPNY